MLLGQSQLCYLLLHHCDGRGIVRLDAAETVKDVVKVTASLNGGLKVLEEVAPVAVVQGVEEDVICALGSLDGTSPFVDTRLRLEESIFSHLCRSSRNTQHATELCHLVNAQSELTGYGIERTCQTATAIDGLVDVVEL